jgi:hypothetical protein
MADVTKKSGWTVMVYMAAADDVDLDAHAVRDLQDMERATLQEGVRVRVQIDRHWPALPQRYTVGDGKSILDRGQAPIGETGTSASLLDFLTWASEGHESDHLFLVLWGHAYGLGFGRDHGDPLTVRELGDALDTFKNDRKGLTLDLLGANACAMSYAEAVFQMKDKVDFLVASQIAVPFAGWPYEAILTSVARDTSPKTLGTIVADRYVNHFRASRVGDQVAMAVLNLKPTTLDRLKNLLEELTNTLTDAITQSNPMLGDRLDHIRSAFLATAAGDVRPLIDLTDLTDKLTDMCEDLLEIERCSKSVCPVGDGSIVALQKAAADLHTFLVPASDQIRGETAVEVDETADEAFLLAHKRHPDLDGLHGIGIFAPFVTDDDDLKRLGLLAEGRPSDQRGQRTPLTARDEYAALDLMQGLGWDRLVYEKLSAGLPPDVMMNIESSGAVTLEDRAAVTQMLSAVDGSFATLERRVAATQLVALDIFKAPTATIEGPDRIIAKPVSGGRERIGRFGTLRLLPREPLAAVLARRTPPSRIPALVSDLDTAQAAQTTNTKDDASTLVTAFQGLEKVVADVERAVRRTVTNGSLGLGFTTGEGLGKRGLGKRGLGKRGLGKRGLGKRGLGKRGLGKRMLGAFLKRKLGDDGVEIEAASLSPSAFEDATAAIVAELFEEVGDALMQLESATSEVEEASLDALAGPVPEGLTVDEVRVMRTDAVRRAFRLLSEVSVDARRTIRRVLGHPVYGFGPNGDGLTAEDRRELARAGGLNGGELTLL